MTDKVHADQLLVNLGALPESRQSQLVLRLIEIAIVSERLVIGDKATELPEFVRDLRGQSIQTYVSRLGDTSWHVLNALKAPKAD